MMNLLRRLLIFVLIFQSFVPYTAQAAFEDRGVGARAPSMGEAHVAVADDANAVYYNPAGLIQLGNSQISSEYGQFVKGLNDGSSLAQTYLSYAQPWRRGHTAIGVAYQSFEAANLFTERTIMVGLGKRIQMQPFGWRGIWSVGTNLKQLYRQFEPDRFTQNAINDAGTGTGQTDPLFNSGYDKTSYSMDVGALYQFGEAYNYTAGVVVTNFNQPDVSFAGDGEKAPMIQKFGLAYRPAWGTMSVEVRKAKRLSSTTDTDLGIGFERHLRLVGLGALTFRGGYQEGSREFKTMSAGLSYHFAKMILDYAFLFPIGNLTETNGTHRMGLTFRLGTYGTDKSFVDYSNTSLLSAFAHNSTTEHVMITRTALARNYTSTQRDLLMRLLIRQYALDDPGLDQVRAEISDLFKKRADVMDWPQLVYTLTAGIASDDRAEITKALNAMVQGDTRTARARLSVISPQSRRDPIIMGVILMALGQEAAMAYRAKDLDKTIDQVRQMVEILPNDEMIVRAYRELLAERSSITESLERERQIEVPEAPFELTAPHPTTPEAEKPVSELETIAKSFGTSLGYYFTRKVSGASAEERAALLNQMKSIYGPTGIDMSVINNELEALAASIKVKAVPTRVESEEQHQAAPQPVDEPVIPKVTPTPAVKPTVPAAPKVKPVPVVPAAPTPAVEKPAPAPESARDPELEREWEYYKQASDRNISDFERVEILKGMLNKYGERGASRINRELERLRKRMNQ